MIPKTRDNVVINVKHRIVSTTLTRTHFTYTKCIWTMEADENTCTSILEMSNSTHRCNPDSNSRKVSGWRIITISDQANHLSAMKPIGIGTRLLILDRTAWTRQ